MGYSHSYVIRQDRLDHYTEHRLGTRLFVDTPLLQVGTFRNMFQMLKMNRRFEFSNNTIDTKPLTIQGSLHQADSKNSFGIFGCRQQGGRWGSKEVYNFLCGYSHCLQPLRVEQITDSLWFIDTSTVQCAVVWGAGPGQPALLLLCVTGFQSEQ